MSISVSFKNNLISLDKLQLPTRYYYFNDEQNYIKLLSIGEGIFPKDKIRTKIKLENSDTIFTTESATKVYPSKKELGINKIDIKLINSNLEFINDELILYNNAKFLQVVKIKSDDNSTFFYSDILSHGRSYEDFDFSLNSGKNSFYINNNIEYLEKYQVVGNDLKDYIKKQNSINNLFAKIYIKTKNNDDFLNKLNQQNLNSFTFTTNKQMLIAVISDINMSNLKQQVNMIWEMYRKFFDKNKFDLGKQ
jgi:urease accessory protein